MVSATNKGKAAATFQVTATVKVMGARGTTGPLAHDEDLSAAADVRLKEKQKKPPGQGGGGGGGGFRWVAKWKVYRTEVTVPGRGHPGCSSDGCTQLLLTLIPTGTQVNIDSIDCRVLTGGACGSAFSTASAAAETKSRVMMHAWLSKAKIKAAPAPAPLSKQEGKRKAGVNTTTTATPPSALGLYDACPAAPDVPRSTRGHDPALQAALDASTAQDGHAAHVAADNDVAALQSVLDASKRYQHDLADAALQVALAASQHQEAHGGAAHEADDDDAALRAAILASKAPQHLHPHAQVISTTEDAELHAAIRASQSHSDGSGSAHGAAEAVGVPSVPVPSEEEQLRWAMEQSMSENAPQPGVCKVP